MSNKPILLSPCCGAHQTPHSKELGYCPACRDLISEFITLEEYKKLCEADDEAMAESDDDEEHDVYCSACGGSGEGMHDGSTCRVCRGSGCQD